MERDGEPITAASLRDAVDTGIRFGAPLAGFVPELEEREAALFCGYTWKEWLGLEQRERVDGVAHFRLHRLIDMHRQDALTQAAESKRRHR